MFDMFVHHHHHYVIIVAGCLVLLPSPAVVEPN